MNIEFEKIECNLCGSNKFKRVFNKPDTWLWGDKTEFNVVKCEKCGLGFLNPRPKISSMHYFYPSKFYTDYDESIYTKRFPSQSKFIPNLDNKNILDIGCARGNFLDYLKNKYLNLNAYGVDPFSIGVKYNHIDFKNTFLEKANYESDFFDVIISWFVFEHLYDPSIYFQEVSRILKKQGKFIFSVPNFNSLWSRIGFWEDVPRHLYFFNKKTLKLYAKKNGLKINKIYFDDNIFDGRGTESFYFLLSRMFGVTWEKRKNKNLSRLQWKVSALGRFLDKIFFKYHWEKKFGISGTMIVEMTK
ncbi:methyltransferase domain-containing protein [Candidatus Dependentiae bacterium]|nr:methyltransferase domain-containing protein [Candidatus Dependentiae bacterium]